MQMLTITCTKRADTENISTAVECMLKEQMNQMYLQKQIYICM